MGGDSGALETKTELGGITVGGEYTMGDMTFGVMGNFGTGDVEAKATTTAPRTTWTTTAFQGYTAKRMGPVQPRRPDGPHDDEERRHVR